MKRNISLSPRMRKILRRMIIAGLVFKVSLGIVWAAGHALLPDTEHNCLQYQKHELPPGASTAVVMKSNRTMCYFVQGKLRFHAPVSYGPGVGPKRVQGDKRTPEGHYLLAPPRRSQNFGTFMSLSYPGKDDVAFAKSIDQKPGGSVGVHGPRSWYTWVGSLQSLWNHSQGCIVLSRKCYEAFAAMVPDPVHIVIHPLEFTPGQ